MSHSAFGRDQAQINLKFMSRKSRGGFPPPKKSPPLLALTLTLTPAASKEPCTIIASGRCMPCALPTFDKTGREHLLSAVEALHAVTLALEVFIADQFPVLSPDFLHGVSQQSVLLWCPAPAVGADTNTSSAVGADTNTSSAPRRSLVRRCSRCRVGIHNGQLRETPDVLLRFWFQSAKPTTSASRFGIRQKQRCVGTCSR